MFKFLKKKLPDTNSLGLKYNVKKSKISIGQYTYGYKNLNIIEYGNGTNLYIGKFTSIAPGVKIFLDYGGHNTSLTSSYPFQHLYNNIFNGHKYFIANGNNKGDVNIGSDVWIGMDVLILNGVTINDGAIIGANSVVTKDVKPYEFVAGNPATHKRYRFDKEIIELLLKIKWWDLNDQKIREIMPILTSQPSKKKLEELVKINNLYR
jgi:acetyltransferase-like isoleucine patch superfamily enzyme